jgi:hypothetical protein
MGKMTTCRCEKRDWVRVGERLGLLQSAGVVWSEVKSVATTERWWCKRINCTLWSATVQYMFAFVCFQYCPAELLLYIHLHIRIRHLHSPHHHTRPSNSLRSQTRPLNNLCAHLSCATRDAIRCVRHRVAHRRDPTGVLR